MSNKMDVTEAVYRIMTDFTCGYCFAQSGYEVVTADCLWRHDNSWLGGVAVEGKAFVIVKCRSCGLPNLLVFNVYYDEHIFYVDENFSPAFYCTSHLDVISVDWDPSDNTVYGYTSISFIGQYPYGKRLSKSIPEQIHNDLQEAGNCLAVNAASACAVMCRRVIERLAESLHIERKLTLDKKLIKMRDMGYIDETLFEALYEVKQWGNIGAHADNSNTIGLEEARNLLELTIQSVEYSYSQEELKIHTENLCQHREDGLPKKQSGCV